MAEPVHQVDSEFLSRNEVEGYKSAPYQILVGKSGATLGAGIDLGQTSERELKNFGVPENLIAKVKMLIGVKGSAQKEALKKYNAQDAANKLSADEVKTFDNRVREALVKRVAEHYESITGKSFLGLPGAAQTALYSICHQFHGPSRPGSRIQKIMKAVAEEKYKDAADAIKKLNKENRRKLEAALLEDLATAQAPTANAPIP